MTLCQCLILIRYIVNLNKKEYDRFYHTKALELNILEDLRRKYGNDLEGYKFDT